MMKQFHVKEANASLRARGGGHHPPAIARCCEPISIMTGSLVSTSMPYSCMSAVGLLIERGHMAQVPHLYARDGCARSYCLSVAFFRSLAP
eukprot:53610-Eustigmatos_ZCMA.PRE.1